MSKRIAIVQSNYIPWKGYFDLIAAVDEFILFDDMQYTRRDWRNRNQIKTPTGVQWITVPVQVKGRYHQRIRDTAIDDAGWARRHWVTLVQNYRHAPFFEEVSALIAPLYATGRFTELTDLNQTGLALICGYLGIGTRITHSWDYDLIEGKSERLAHLCAQAGGTVYVSGPAARTYLDEAAFAARGIEVSWFDYAGYPEHPQLWGAFTHGVTILDLIFNCGRDAPRYMKLGRA